MSRLHGNNVEEVIITANKDWDALFNTLTDSITVHDADFNIVRMNASALELLGLQLQDQVSSKKCYRYYHGSDKPPSHCASCQTIKTGKPSTTEIFEPFLNKRLEIRALPRFGNDGKLEGLIHIVRDVTDRKRAEEELQQAKESLEHRVEMRTEALLKDILERKRIAAELKESEDEYRSLASTVDYLILVDSDCRYLLANESYLNLFGFEKADVIGKLYKELHDEETTKVFTDAVKKALETGRAYQDEWWGRRSNKCVLRTFSPLNSSTGGLAKVTVSAKDITERKLVEQKLAESEAKYRSLASTMDRLFLVDRDCRYLFANQAYLNLFGGLKDLVIGKKHDELYDAETYRIFAKAVNHVFATGQSYQDEWLGKRHGKYLLRTFSPIQSSDGSVAAVTVASIDITERRKVEEALLASEQMARRLSQENKLMAEIAKIVSSTLDIESIFEGFAEKVREVIPLDRIAILTVESECYTRILRFVHDYSLSENPYEAARTLAGTRTEQVVRTKSSLFMNSKNREKMVKKYPTILPTSQSLMMVPLISNDVALGTLNFHSLQIDAYSENDLRLAERVGNQIAGAIASAQLFFEQKRTEQALQTSERHFRGIIDQNPISMAVIRMDGIIEYINHRAVDTFGYEHTDIPDMEHWWPLAYPDEQYRNEVIEQWMGLVRKAIELHREIESREYRITCKDGKIKTVMVFGTIIAEKVFVMFEDITELKNIEELLRNHAEMLEQLVMERTTELAERNKELVDMNTALQVLLKKRETDKRNAEELIVSNIKNLVYPYLEKMKNNASNAQQHLLLSTIDTNLNELLSSVLKELRQFNLSPKEVQVATMVKNGKTTKEIAEILGVETGSIDTHRNSIRKKLGLSRNVNLHSKLQSFT